MDEQPEQQHGLKRLFRSSRAWVALFAIVGAIIMNVLGRIDGEHALSFIKWIVIANIGATALEDTAAKLRSGDLKPADIWNIALKVLQEATQKDGEEQKPPDTKQPPI